MKDDFFEYLIATDKLDDFLGKTVDSDFDDEEEIED